MLASLNPAIMHFTIVDLAIIGEISKSPRNFGIFKATDTGFLAEPTG